MNETKRQEPTVYADRDMAEPAVHQLPGGEVVLLSARAPQKGSRTNEDAAAVFPYREAAVVLAVADGMGGQPGGHEASPAALRALRSALARAANESLMLRSAILNGFEKAGEEVRTLGVGAGTTLAAVELQDGSVRPYHVGDSMILVTGQRGRIKLQTIAHSPVGLAVEAGVMNEREAMLHEARHLVLNMVGSPDMRIEVGPMIRLDRYDTVLLATDGLADNLSMAEIVDGVRAGPLIDAVKRLAAAARLRMTQPSEGQPSKPDDLTLLVYRRSTKS